MKRMRAPERRRQILEVAASLFARHGYRGTTTARLAAEAGITEPVLYQHFASKHELFVTLIEEVSIEVVERWTTALEAASDPRARLHVLLAGNPATHERGRGIYRVILQAMGEVETDAHIAEALRNHVQRLHEFLVGELAHLQDAGALRHDVPPDDLAWFLVNVGTGSGVLAPMTSGAPVPGRGHVQEIVEHLLTSAR